MKVKQMRLNIVETILSIPTQKVVHKEKLSPAMGFSVCHFAMGLRGFANISDQCFNSALVELQPTSTQPVDNIQIKYLEYFYKITHQLVHFRQLYHNQ